MVKRAQSALSFVALLAGLGALAVTGSVGRVLDVRDFGAKGDGATLDTRAIQAAIDSCSKRGGTVVLRGGTFLSGTVVLRSNVRLEISAGATLLGSTNPLDYPAMSVDIPSYNDSFLNQSLIFADGQKNIAITGMGTVDGQGGAFKVTTNKKPDRYRNRPFGLRIVNCGNVLVENVTMTNSAMWMQQYFACDGVVIRGIKVYNHCNKNNDMIDIDSSRNVVMSDCFGDTDDDAITIKSTTGRIAENITISNCVVSSHVNAIKLGTESHGGFRNITISNIVVRPSAHPTKIYGTANGLGGITLGMVDGGILDGVVISDIRMDGVANPIFMRLGNRGRTYFAGQEKPGVGTFRNVSISNIVATGAGENGCALSGLPDYPIENISLSNIRIQFAGGGTAVDATREPPENEKGYPGSTIFGRLPAHGFFVRHASGVILNNIHLSSGQSDLRPALIADDVADLDVQGLRAGGSGAGEAIRLVDTRDVVVSASRPLGQPAAFVSVRGAASSNIDLAVGPGLDNATAAVVVADDVPADAVRLFHEQRSTGN